MGKSSDKVKSLESWIWDAACSIRGAKDAPKYKDYILPLVFTKRLCDVFDDEINRIAAEVGSRDKAFLLAKADHKLVRFYLPLVPKDPEQPVWSVIRKLSDKIGEGVTSHMRAIAKQNPLLQGIIDRVDFNATTHGQRDLDDDRLSNLIEAISTKRLGLDDVEADIIGKSYEYLIRKFAEGSGRSAGEFYTPPEVGEIMAKVLAPEPGMDIYDPCCGSGGLLIKCEIAMESKTKGQKKRTFAPLKLYGQEYIPETWAMANMNMIIHDMEGQIEIGDTFKNPKFRRRGKLRTFDRVVANPMWNQKEYSEKDYDADELDRFPAGAGFPGKSSADWGWVQHIHASLKPEGRAAVVLDTGAASRGSGNANTDKEKPSASGSSTTTSSRASSTCPRTCSTTLPPRASSSFSTGTSPRLGQVRSCSSTPVRSSKRETPRTSSRPRGSTASPMSSPTGRKKKNSAASSIMQS